MLAPGSPAWMVRRRRSAIPSLAATSARRSALVEHQLGFGGEGKALEILPAGHVVQPVPIEGVRFTHGGEPGLQGTKLVLANVIDRAQRTDHHAGRHQPNSYETHSRHSPPSHLWIATWIHAAISSARRRRGASLSGPGYR